MGSLIIIVAMFALLWVLMIRPQRAKQQHQKRMLEAVAPGDEILTVGGLFGIVQEIDEDGDLVVEIAEGIHVRIARRAVATVVKPDEEDVLDDEDDDLVEGEGEPLKESGAEVEDEADVKDEEDSVKADAAGPAAAGDRS